MRPVRSSIAQLASNHHLALFPREDSSNSSTVMTQHASALNESSGTFCQEEICDGDPHHYVAMYIIANVPGEYTIKCNSSIDTYGFMYNGTFDAANPSENVLVSNDDGAGDRQFQLDVYLESSVNYILVVSTYSPDITGPFIITATGPGSIFFWEIPA